MPTSMTIRSTHQQRGFWQRALAIGALALLAPSANAAVTTVYKCFDRSLGVLYTDQPCRGESISIEAGATDAAAVAELQREREAVSRSAAQRIADNRRAGIDRDYAPRYVYAGPPVADFANDIYYPAGYGYYGGYGGYGYGGYPQRAQRPDGPRPDVRRDRPSVSVPSPNLINRAPPPNLVNRR